MILYKHMYAMPVHTKAGKLRVLAMMGLPWQIRGSMITRLFITFTSKDTRCLTKLTTGEAPLV